MNQIHTFVFWKHLTHWATQDQSAAFLYLPVESSLPKAVFKAWQSSYISGYEEGDSYKLVNECLKLLVKCLREKWALINCSTLVKFQQKPERKGIQIRKRKESGQKQFKPTNGSISLFIDYRSSCTYYDKTYDTRSDDAREEKDSS